MPANTATVTDWVAHLVRVSRNSKPLPPRTDVDQADST